jgi:hypothetical protein
VVFEPTYRLCRFFYNPGMELGDFVPVLCALSVFTNAAIVYVVWTAISRWHGARERGQKAKQAPE